MYHSALKSQGVDQNTDICERVESGESVAFAFDINKCQLPKEYDRCDVLYIEPSWKSGIREFNKRAGVKDYAFLQYKSALESIVGVISIPLVIVAGSDFNDMPFQKKYYTKLNGYPCFAFVFGKLELQNVESNESILSELADKFNCIGDFCCGYGLSGKIFRRYGKEFVMSDYNKRCINYIKENIEKW